MAFTLKIRKLAVKDIGAAYEWYEDKKTGLERNSFCLLAPGSRIAFVAHFLGRKLAYTYEVVEFSKEKFVMRTAEGPFPMETTYTFKSDGERSTLMTLRNRGNPSGFSRLFSPFMAMMMRRANNKDLKNIKAILERM